MNLNIGTTKHTLQYDILRQRVYGQVFFRSLATRLYEEVVPFVAIILIICNIIAGLMVPLKPGIIQLSPSVVSVPTLGSFTQEYNGQFTSESQPSLIRSTICCYTLIE